MYLYVIKYKNGSQRSLYGKELRFYNGIIEVVCESDQRVMIPTSNIEDIDCSEVEWEWEYEFEDDDDPDDGEEADEDKDEEYDPGDMDRELIYCNGGIRTAAALKIIK